MRLMSFALTIPQILDQSKTVTRRIGWSTLTPGTLIQPVRKVMGRKKGEPLDYLGGPILVIDVRREPLNRLALDRDYGVAEMILEGFPAMLPANFCLMLGDANHFSDMTTQVTRIEFTYTKDGRAHA